MSLSIVDKIKLKTKEILVKTDDYLGKSNTFGSQATMHGMAFAGVAAVAGIVGVMAIVAAPALPAIAGVAAMASMPALAIGGASINLAGASLIAGGASGIAFAGLAKLYSAVRGTQDKYVRGEFECIVRDKSVNPSLDNDKVFDYIDVNNVVKVNRKEVLKSIENGTFHDKYVGIRINGVNGHEHSYHKVPEGMPLEAAANIPFKNGPTEINITNQEWKEDCKVVRRECFKEAKTFDLKAKILNRISAFREEVEGHKVTSKYKI